MKARLAAICSLLVLACSGCARPDWIESTLVTVDVTGPWQGMAGRDHARFPIELQLKQTGARVSGSFTMTTRPRSGQLEGSVNGDVFSFTQVGGGLHGELTVGVDEMTGWVARTGDDRNGQWTGRLTITLKRR